MVMRRVVEVFIVIEVFGDLGIGGVVDVGIED